MTLASGAVDPASVRAWARATRTAGERHGVGATGRTVSSEIRQGERIVRLSNLDKPYWPEAGIGER